MQLPTLTEPSLRIAISLNVQAAKTFVLGPSAYCWLTNT